jgi:heat shock protein HslJ
MKYKLICIIAIFLSYPISTEALTKRDIAKIHVKRWELVELQIPSTGRIISAKELCGSNYAPSIDFKTDGKFSGGICCNFFNGQYRFSSAEPRLIIESNSFSALACIPEPSLNELELISKLHGDIEVNLSNSELSLRPLIGDVVLRYQILN